MLTANKEILFQAHRKGYSIAQININNLEWIKAVLETAQELQSPIILGVSEKAAHYMGGFKTVFQMVKSLDDFYRISVPVFLHLDHGSFESVYKALEANFTSIMFSCSSNISFEKQLIQAKEIIKICKQKNVLIETEVGSLDNEKSNFNESEKYSDPQQCYLMSTLGIDMLAAEFGNIHGHYDVDWKGLNFEVLQQVKFITNNIPLVLHGGSGIPDEMIKKSISLGVAKINVNTDCQLAFATATKQYVLSNNNLEKKGFKLQELLRPGFLAIKEIIKKKLILFGSVNKA